MEFNKENYPAIQTACKNRQDIEFRVDRSETAFASKDAPAEWQDFPQAPISNHKLLLYFNNEKRYVALVMLDYYVTHEGGRVFYKKCDVEDMVAVKIEWPEKQVAEGKNYSNMKSA